MKYFLFSIGLFAIFSACTLGGESSSDPKFDEFYQGSPQDFKQENTTSNTPSGSGFSFSGGNSQWQCTVHCEPTP